MKNILIIIGFIIVAITLYLVWGSLSVRLVAIESTTGTYLYDDEPENEDYELIDEVDGTVNVDLRPLLEQLARLEAAQVENSKAINKILQRLDELAQQGCSGGNCANRIVSREIIFFEHDDAKLSAEAMASLDRLLDKMNDHSLVSLRGHADTRGDNQYNHLLSLRRADAVKRYIDAKRLAGDRLHNLLITTDGIGEESAVSVTGDEVEDPSSRMVEILVFE